MTLDEKVKIYQRVVAALSKGVKLAALLDRDGTPAEQAAVRRKNEALAREAARIRRAIHQDWRGGAAAILDGIGTASSRLQEQIRAIETTRKTAERAVRALGYVDDLIAIAARVAAAM